MAKTRKNYPEALKAKVAIEAIKGEKSAAELATIYGVHPVVIGQWKKQLLTHAQDLFIRGGGKPSHSTDVNNEALYAEIGRLKLENDWLKKKL
jgi:transposase-like protein